MVMIMTIIDGAIVIMTISGGLIPGMRRKYEETVNK